MGIAAALTGRAAIFRRCIVIAAIAAPATATPPAHAGDEVDYSAPYVTVENGELVTRYPAKEHDEPNVAEEPAAAPGDEATRPSLAASVCIAAAFGIATAFLVVVRRRALARRASRRRSTDAL